MASRARFGMERPSLDAALAGAGTAAYALYFDAAVLEDQSPLLRICNIASRMPSSSNLGP